MQPIRSLYPFFIVSLLELLAVWFEHELGQFIFKPLLMPALIFHFYVQSKGQTKQGLYRYIMLALLFSMGGDVALLLNHLGELSFILGLASFLIAHVCYILAFGKLGGGTSIGFMKRLSQGTVWPLALVLLAYGIGLYSYLFPKLDTFLKIPVGVYAGVITLMAISLLQKKNDLNQNVFLGMFVGVLLFIFSDSCIAINRFAMPIAKANFIIMITYIAAQYLIIQGIIKYQKGNSI